MVIKNRAATAAGSRIRFIPNRNRGDFFKLVLANGELHVIPIGMVDDVEGFFAFVADFAEAGIKRLAEIAFQVNEKTENIGARRLHTVMEKLLEEVSFDAGKIGLDKVRIDAAYVNEKLGEVAADEDLSRYVL